MFKKITVRLSVCIPVLLLAFLLIGYPFLVYFTSMKNPEYEPIEFETLIDLFELVEKAQAKKDPQRIIDILRSVNIDKLVASELKEPRQRFVAIAGIGLVAHGIKDIPTDKDIKYTVFPGTSDAVESGYDFWILYAERFTTEFNSRLQSEMVKKNIWTSRPAQVTDPS